MNDDAHRWPHRPPHFFVPYTMYMVTASTLYKQRLFHDDQRRTLLHDSLLEVAQAFDWKLQAWAVFSNHYHFIGQSPSDATTLRRLIQRLHSQTSRLLNRMDGMQGRQVWFQFWDTCLTNERSYYARLNYVHNNAVKHGLVQQASQYPYCSAAWFQANANRNMQTLIEQTPYDSITIDDEYTDTP